MKKIAIIVLFVVAFCFVSPSSSYSQGKDRLKIEVRGFDNNVQTQLMVSKFMADNADWAIVVDANPKWIMRVTQQSGYGQTWTQVDQKAQTRNNMVRSGNQTIRSVTRNSPFDSWWGRTIKQTIRQAGQSQLQRFAKPERYQYRKEQSSVTVEVIDPITREVASKAIGITTITVKTLRMSGYEPQTYLVEGDLSSVGIEAGANLFGTYRQLLQLSAFMNAQRPENHIIQ